MPIRFQGVNAVAWQVNPDIVPLKDRQRLAKALLESIALNVPGGGQLTSIPISTVGLTVLPRHHVEAEAYVIDTRSGWDRFWKKPMQSDVLGLAIHNGKDHFTELVTLSYDKHDALVDEVHGEDVALHFPFSMLKDNALLGRGHFTLKPEAYGGPIQTDTDFKRATQRVVERLQRKLDQHA